VILGKSPRNGVKFHMFDLNNDSKITVSDKYYLLARKSGIFSSWSSSVPDTRFFTSSEYNALKNGTSNMRSLYPGVSQITTSTLTSGGSLTYYLIAPGYSGKVTY
jgi:hypothetical protein